MSVDKTPKALRWLMQTLHVTTLIRAPAVRCFDLARSVDAHLQSAAGSRERAVGGKTSGLLSLNDVVTWEARHLGVTQQLTSRITALETPTFFQDRMEAGAFRHLEHDHVFQIIDPQTTSMTDILRYAAPLGPIGWLAERVVIGPYLRRFLIKRGRVLRELAESEAWRRLVEA